MAVNNPQSIDEAMGISSPGAVPFGDAGAQSPPDTIDSAMGITPPNPNKPLSLQSRRMGQALVGGVASGATLGYSDNALPEAAEAEKEYPVTGFLGKMVGGLGPAKAVGAGLNILSEAPQVAQAAPWLSKAARWQASPGVAQGITEGAGYGGASDPGPNGSRIERAAEGAGIGGILGGLVSSFGHLGDVKDVYDKLSGESGNFASEVKGKIDSALSDLMASGVNPQKAQLQNLQADKTVSINPDYIRGFQRPSIIGPERMKGGLDTLADTLADKGWGSQTEIPASRAQDMKEYFDSRANYSRQKPFSETANASGDREQAAADYLRTKLRDIPGVDDLNLQMRDALNLKQNIQAPSEGGPIGTISTSNPDKQQQLMDLDRRTGSDLSGLGALVRKAKGMQGVSMDDVFAPSAMLHPWKLMHDVGSLADYGAGSVSQAARDYIPSGSDKSILNSLLLQLRNQQQPQQ